MSMSSGGTSFNFSGLGSGLDTAALVESLMAIERRPQQMLQQKVAARQNVLGQFQAMNNFFARIKSSAEDLNLPTAWKSMKATSSDASVTASAGTGALTGSLSFSVKNLATAQTLASFGTVASTGTVVGSGSALFGLANTLGIASMKGTGITDGAHTLTVTQSSSGASLSGSAVADSITLNGTETLEVNISGSTRTINLTAGTYTQKQLAEMVTTASSGALKVSVNADKSLNVATAREGSAASLSITGGTGLAALGLSVAGPVNGSDGIITVDGVANTLTNIDPTSSTPVTLNGSAGTIDVTFSGGLRTGTANVKSVNLGDGKLSTVVTNINAANIGLTAAAIQTAPNQFRLQLSSNTTGTAGAISADMSAFSGVLGQLQVVQAAQDAKITVGSGVNSYDITSSSNSVSNVLPGVSLTLNSADPAKTVTVGIAGDAAGMADKVQTLVSNVNQALSFIKQNSAYNASTKTAGALLGDGTASRLQSKLFTAMTSSLQSTPLGHLGAVGITSQADGTFLFNREKFLSAYNANPEAVASAFVEGGSTGTTTLTKPGIAETLLSLAKSATDSVTGAITTAISGENSRIADLNRQVAGWETRLTQKQTMLRQQFTSLETAMSRFNSQGNWLAGQLSQFNR